MNPHKLQDEPTDYADHFGGIMDFSALNFLWAIILLPLGWLFKLVKDVKQDQNRQNTNQWGVINGLRRDLNEVDKKADKAVNEQRVREILKEEMEPVRADIRALTTAVSEIPLKVQQSIHELELKLIEARHRNDQ